ncbi:hypothetical protein BDF14DRAFT_1544712 [Spinellus fusiger]|nr:hypothetical protein BDF14DRAFT_1544712 [Spinellus fusiger]
MNTAKSTSPSNPSSNSSLHRIDSSLKYLSHASEMMSLLKLQTFERWMGEFSYYMVYLVTLPGFLCLTDNYICFYGALLWKESEKSGYLSKKAPSYIATS